MNIFVASGNLGKDIELRTTQNGKTVGSFSLPVKQGWGDHEKVSWIDCKLLGERANKLAQYLTKGTKVTVAGEFVYEEWETDGVKKGKPVVIVSEIDLHGSKNQGQQPSQPQSQPAAPQNFDNFDDDIPF